MLKVKCLLGLSLMVIGLQSCTAVYLPGPSAGGLNVESFTGLLKQMRNGADFKAFWSPQGGKVAIISSYWNSETAALNQETTRAHDIAVYDTATGEVLATWYLDTHKLFQTDAFRREKEDEPELQLQWQSGENGFAVLTGFQTRQQESLELFSFQVPSQRETPYTTGPTPLKRQIFIPAALKSLSTTGVGKFRLSPNGQQVGLYRYLDPAQDKAEVMVLDLKQGETRSLGEVNSSQPLLSPQWNRDSQSLFVLSQSEAALDLMQLFPDKAQTKHLPLTLKTQQKIWSFGLSPDQSQVAIEMQSTDITPKSAVLLANLKTGQQQEHAISWQSTKIGSFWSPSGELGLEQWGASRPEPQFSTSNSEFQWLNPATGQRNTFATASPIQLKLQTLFQRSETSQLTKDVTAAENSLALRPQPDYMSVIPGSFELAAVSPVDTRALILVDNAWTQNGRKVELLNLVERPFAFVLDPTRQRLLPLKRSLGNSLGFGYTQSEFQAPAEISLK